MLIIRLFNGFYLQHHETPLALPSQGSRSLLAYCAAYPHQIHSRSRLAGIFWPDLPETTARRRLSHALWEIGQSVPSADGRGYLTRTADAIGFNRHLPHHIDRVEFEAAWRRAQESASLESARLHLQQATDLYTGDFLAGFYDEWAVIEQERLREVYMQVLLRLIEAEKAANDYEAAVRATLALIAADPLREDAYQEGMRLYQQMSRPQEARRLYEQGRAVLQAELEVDPTAETQAILDGIVDRETDAHRLALAFTGQDLPLVGRDLERRALLHHLDEAQHGRGGVVLVSGEAGVGKTRLLRALADDAQWRAMTVLWGSAQDMTADAPYAPLAAALAEGISPLRAQQLSAVLDRLWLSVASRLLPPLRRWLPQTPLPPALNTEQERMRLLEGIVRVVLALGDIAPLLLILEDVHWADEATFDALAYLAQRLPSSRVLLVATFRPGDARHQPAVWAGLDTVDRVGVRQRLALEPLSVDETTDLVRRGLGLREPATLFAARLHAETGGNPLFVLESLRTLYAEGLLARDADGHWTTPYDQETADYAELPLSPAVDQTIARRLARLGPVERAVLGAAAVVGSEVDLALLMALNEMAGRDLLTALGELLRHNLLQETATAYRFSHDTVRETVYAEMSASARRTLHRRAGDVLSKDERAAPTTVAHHFEAGEDWARAIHFYWRAGEEALNLHSYRATLSHLERVESLGRLGTPVVDPFDLLSRREEVLALLGERDPQRATLDDLTALATGNSDRLLTVHTRYGRFLNDVGDHKAAVDRLEIGLALARARADAQAEAQMLALLGKTLYWQGELQAALPVLSKAIQRAQAIDALAVEAEAQTSLSGVLYDLSDHEGANAAGLRAIELYRRLQNPVGEADVLATLGAVAMEEGRLDDADLFFSQALPVIQSSGYRYAEARCLVNWGSIDYLRGRLGDALERFRLGAQIFQQIGSERGLHFTNLNIAATVSTYVGLDDQAEALTRQALEAFAEQANISAQAQALGILGQFAYLRGDLDRALQFYDEGMRSIESAPDPWVKAQNHQARAVSHLARAAWEAARQDIEAGLDLCKQYGFEELIPLLHAQQSQALLGLNRPDDARAAVEEAIDGKEVGYSAHLVHFYRHRVLRRCGDHDGALMALHNAHDALQRILSSLPPAEQNRSRQQIPEHRAILAAWDAEQPTQRRVRLPRLDAPLGRPLTADEEIEITWTVETAADRQISSKTRRRQEQIARLLREAHAQDASPAYHHLAEALDVSERTIKRDMAALRRTRPDLPPTRGA